jgi:hypothetical protein
VTAGSAESMRQMSARITTDLESSIIREQSNPEHLE